MLRRQAYDSMAFREAVKAGYFDLQSARDRYRFAVGPHGMHGDLAMKYIEVRVLIPFIRQLGLSVEACPDHMEGWRSTQIDRGGTGAESG